MTNPLDPITPPSLPPPDPVLQPPAPMPWDQPWQPSPPPAQPPPAPRKAPRKVPRDPVIITRPAPSTPRPQPTHITAPTVTPTPAPPTPIETAGTPTWRPERKRRKRPGWLTIGIIAAVAICGGNIVDGIRDAPDNLFVVDPPPTPRERATGESAAIAGPATTVDGGPASFDLPIGTGVRFSDQDGTWIVALTGVERVDECADLVGSTVPVVVFDIAYEVVEGGVSVWPTNDFAFELANGTTVRPSLLPACAEPPLDISLLFAEDVYRGRVAVELPDLAAASGKLTYGQLGTPTASWTVP